VNSRDVPGSVKRGRGPLFALALLFLASVDIHSCITEARSDSQPSSSPSPEQVTEEELSLEKIKTLARYTHSDVEQIPTMIQNGKIPRDCIQENEVWSFRGCMQKKGFGEWLNVQIQIFEDADFKKPFQWSVIWRSLVGLCIYGVIGGPLKSGMDRYGEKSGIGSICGCLGTILTIFFGLPMVYFLFAGLL
jgi:hypothetical protein